MKAITQYGASGILLVSLLVAGPRASPAAVGRTLPQGSAPETTDLIVVGAGIAGLSAALEAARGGARVAVIDMWSIFGGHAVMAEGGLCLIDTPLQRSQGIQDSPDLAYRDFIEWGEDASPEWVRYYVDHSRTDVYDWLTPLGVGFDQIQPVPGNSVPRFHRTRGRGLALVSPIYRECVRNPGIRFVWNTKIVSLVRDQERVVGVRGQDLRTQETREFRAAAVLLATGGFQSNLEMVREFWPRDLPFPDGILAGSGVNSVGSGHEVARQAGAALQKMDHQWNYATGIPDPRHPGLRRGLNASNADSLWVNRAGKRFVNEQEGVKVTFATLLAQKPATYWAIFDERGKRTFWISGSDWGDFAVIQKLVFDDPHLVQSAGSLVELAKAAGLPPAALEETVRRYNQLVDGGEDRDFGRFGRAAPAPPRIETAPFYAVQFFPLTRKSMGGVAIDRGCRVLDDQGRAISGLYAAGELTGLAGINGKAGLEGTFLGPSILTGRVAARTVLATLEKPTTPGGPDPAAHRPAPAPARSTASPACLGCHDLAGQIATSRSGFSHFEKVHRVVLERKYDCARCHATLQPFAAETHRIDRLEQIDSCGSCHVSQER